MAWARGRRAARDRGRLRRRVPLRPPPARGAAGARPAARRLPRLGEQGARARPAARLARAPRRARRAAVVREKALDDAGTPSLEQLVAGAADRRRRARPPPAPRAPALRGAARRARRGARGRAARRHADRDGRRPARGGAPARSAVDADALRAAARATRRRRLPAAARGRQRATLLVLGYALPAASPRSPRASAGSRPRSPRRPSGTERRLCYTARFAYAEDEDPFRRQEALQGDRQGQGPWPSRVHEPHPREEVAEA